MSTSFLILDLMPLTAAVLASIACGLLGSLLVLRRESLLGDAISHAVLPGIVFAFLLGAAGNGLIDRLTGGDARNPVLMLVGASLAGLLCVVLIELVKRVGRVEPGAAMGVVFSVFFAGGVYLMQQVARNVDLDASCVLYGDLEGLIWVHAGNPLSAESLASIPRQVLTLAAVVACAIIFVATFFKELRLASFDPQLATSLGIRSSWLSIALLLLVAAATVAAFEAVGSILVISMLISPGATARLLTDRLWTYLVATVAIAAVTAALGYFAGAHLLSVFSVRGALNIAGTISVTGALLFATTALLAPTQGVLARRLHRLSLARRVALEDLLGSLYRLRETGVSELPIGTLTQARSRRPRPQSVLAAAERAALILRRGDVVTLTTKGVATATELVRRHRLWESYLVERAGLSPDHVHDPAEQLEHILAVDEPAHTDRALDPHGREIPKLKP